MKPTKLRNKDVKAKVSPWVRASISFPPEMYEALEQRARQKKVSLAWIVRDASEKYLTGSSTAVKDE